MLRGGGTTSVDAFPRGASPYGMAGMAGNVFEWCEDVYDDGFYLHGPERNPRNTIQPGSAPCVIRGGAWAIGHPEKLIDFAYRSTPQWDTYASLLGFARRIRRDQSDLGPRDMIDAQSFIWTLGSAEYG